MPRRIIFDKVLLNSEATQTSTALEWSNVSGVEPPTADTPMTAEAHRFILNGVKFEPNYFLNGETKFKCAYRMNNTDTIMLELNKETGLANIKLRKDRDLPLGEDSNYLVFYEIGNDKPVNILINLAGESCIVVYKDGEFKIQEEV